MKTFTFTVSVQEDPEMGITDAEAIKDILYEAIRSTGLDNAGMKVDSGNFIAGLEMAIKIVESREATGNALNCGDEYMHAFKDVLIFLQAELWRQKNPEQAAHTHTVLD